MTRSELIGRLAGRQPHLPYKVVEAAVRAILDHMVYTLAQGRRIEIRGFGSLCLHYRAPREGRNPRTGEKVNLIAKCVPHFKPGRELRQRVNIHK